MRYIIVPTAQRACSLPNLTWHVYKQSCSCSYPYHTSNWLGAKRHLADLHFKGNQTVTFGSELYCTSLNFLHVMMGQPTLFFWACKKAIPLMSILIVNLEVPDLCLNRLWTELVFCCTGDLCLIQLLTELVISCTGEIQSVTPDIWFNMRSMMPMEKVGSGIGLVGWPQT